MIKRLGKKIAEAAMLLYFFTLSLYWIAHPKRESVIFLPFGNSWLLVRKDGSKIFLPRTRCKPQPEPYERYFKVKPGETVVDAGACIGEFTVPAAKKAKRVIAIEAAPENVIWLKKNIEANGLGNVCIIEKAVWNRKKLLKLHLRESIGKHSLVPTKRRRECVKVQADTLDHILFRVGIKKVDFLKMDVEGAEIEALEGAKRILEVTNKIVIETHVRNARKTTFQVKRFLKTRDFEVRVETRSDTCDMVYAVKK